MVEFIERKGITMYRLAKDSNISPDTAYKFQDPRYLPSIKVVEKICDTYCVSPEELLQFVSNDCDRKEV
jgi:hypothetical protein